MNKQIQSSKNCDSDFKRLLAKSRSKTGSLQYFEILQGHTAQVLDAAETLLKNTADDLLKQLGLDASVWSERFKRAVTLGAFLHDFGKANDQFQNMVRRLRDVKTQPQSIRHEALSGILCTQVKDLREWLCPASVSDSELIFQAAICAVVGHHLKTDKPTRDSIGLELKVYLNHKDFKGLLQLGAKRLNLGSPPKFGSPFIYSLSDEQNRTDIESLSELKERLYTREGPSWFDRPDQETKKWLAAVKAMVVASDVAGSALPSELSNEKNVSRQTRESLKGWIQKALEDVLSTEDMNELVRERLRGSEKNEERERFQQDVEESESRVTLVRAGCGAGKTIAAYRWASQRANQCKLFFCYPTTGTASEGFNGYVSKSKVEGTLMHSRAVVDLDNIFQTPDDLIEVGSKGEVKEIPDLRLESLQAWSPPLVVCTVDSVLGLIQNNRRGLYSFPAFARAAFVFDEIHSYDPKLFGALLKFLKTFQGADVLLMTASLPVHMLKALERVCGQLVPIQGPQKREDAPRYKLQHLQENPEAQAWKEAEKVLLSGGKVLWIANTVDRTVKLYDESRERDFFKQNNFLAHLYHSRFRYFERRENHKRVVEAFDPKKIGAAFAITTQVAEMSLDLSADLLITDLAPPASLIQRLGRLNRHEDEPKEVPLALILEPDDAMPYVKPNGASSDDFLLAYEWLKRLLHYPQSVSQTDLAEELKVVSSAQTSQQAQTQSRRGDSAWLDDGWKSQVDTLRVSDFSVPIVLERDVPIIRDAGKGLSETKGRMEKRKEAIRCSLSIPGRASVNGWERLKEHGLYRIAPNDEVSYCEKTGAKWREVKK
ncbi:MAG: CRISPR-associated helicase Cas3' [Acidobacteriota bacterium]